MGNPSPRAHVAFTPERKPTFRLSLSSLCFLLQISALCAETPGFDGVVVGTRADANIDAGVADELILLSSLSDDSVLWENARGLVPVDTLL